MQGMFGIDGKKRIRPTGNPWQNLGNCSEEQASRGPYEKVGLRKEVLHGWD